jgi:hypothetical protein
VSQKLNGLEACNSRLYQVCLGIAEQLMNTPCHREAGGVVGEDGVAQSQDQCFRSSLSAVPELSSPEHRRCSL